MFGWKLADAWAHGASFIDFHHLSKCHQGWLAQSDSPATAVFVYSHRNWPWEAAETQVGHVKLVQGFIPVNGIWISVKELTTKWRSSPCVSLHVHLNLVTVGQECLKDNLHCESQLQTAALCGWRPFSYWSTCLGWTLVQIGICWPDLLDMYISVLCVD